MKILVGPLEQVATLCTAHRPSHLVSWLSHPADWPEPSAEMQRLRLASHDIAKPTDGFTSPAAEHVEQLLAFACDWTGERPLLVHCWAGVSRSTAAAFTIACAKRPDLAEIALASRLRDAAPSATPNLLIVALADVALGRQGRMSAAVAAIGRGCDTLLGTPFALDLGRER